jgi:hypothetical protein
MYYLYHQGEKNRHVTNVSSVRFEDFTAVTMKNSVYWDVTRCGTLRTDVVPCSPNLATLMTEAICSFETSILTRITQRSTPGDGFLHSHSRKNLKPYKESIVLCTLIVNVLFK